LTNPGHPTVQASSVRVGAHWIVTVRYAGDELNSSRFAVVQRDGGYCVSRLLREVPPTITPSSPAPYTGTASSSPPR
jgi:hypothetical protein